MSDYRNELISPGVARLRLYIRCANLALFCQILGVCPRVPGLSVAPVTGSLVGFLDFVVGNGGVGEPTSLLFLIQRPQGGDETSFRSRGDRP